MTIKWKVNNYQNVNGMKINTRSVGMVRNKAGRKEQMMEKEKEVEEEGELDEEEKEEE